MRRNNLLLLIGLGLFSLVCLAPRGTTANEFHQSKPAEVKIDPRRFDELIGQYAFVESPDLVLSVFREGDKFFIQATNQGRIEVFPASETKFFLKIIDADATFARDEQGKVISVLWRQNGQQTTARKTGSQPAIEKSVAFDKREETIRMRDGVRLHTLIFTPNSQNESLPILFERTPYGVGDSDSDAINRRFRDFIADGYEIGRASCRERV